MRFLKRLYTSQFIRGSVLFFLAGNIASLGNFLFNLISARILKVEEYGDLGTVFSTTALLGIPLSVLGLILVKTVSAYWGKKEFKIIKGLFTYISTKSLVLGLGIAAVSLLVASWIASYLRLTSITPVFYIILFSLLTIPATINRSFLQGTLNFSLLTINSITESFSKLIVGVILLWLNFGLIGALTGSLAGLLFGLAFSFVEVKWVFRKIKNETKNGHGRLLVKNFSGPLLVTIVLTLFVNIDVIMAHRYLAAAQAGAYVAISSLGRIGYYFIGPVISVMFPLVTSRVHSGRDYLLPLLGTLVASLLVGMGLVSLYLLFPELIINLLLGIKYQQISGYMGIFTVFVTLYSLNSVLSYFLLSISYYKPIYLLFAVSLLPAILMTVFHQSIDQFITINVFCSLIYFIIASFFIFLKEKNLLLNLKLYG